MEPLWLFSPAETSIDVVVGLAFAVCLYRAVWRLWLNDLTTEGKILLSFIAVIASAHLFQVLTQVLFGGPLGQLTFRIWDFINFLTAFLFLMAVERINHRERL